MAGFAMAGLYVGTVIGMPLSGIFASYYGWQSIFYIFGAVAMVWFILWILIVKKSPEADSHISKAERDYILASLGDGLQRNTIPKFSEIPWKDIFTSKAVWAIVIAHFCESWGFFTMFTQLPSFLKGRHFYSLEF
jgi:MFS transporter, ACS family, solute carrier family 17 (sodium-dependent inorganic phosphate cotransporter), other